MKLSIKFLLLPLKIKQGIQNDKPLIITGNYRYYPPSSFRATQGDASYNAKSLYVFSMLTISMDLNITTIFIL